MVITGTVASAIHAMEKVGQGLKSRPVASVVYSIVLHNGTKMETILVPQVEGRKMTITLIN